jgi:hypothetical protein
MLTQCLKGSNIDSGMIDRLPTVRCCGVDIDVKKTELMRMSRPSCPVQIMIDQKHLGNMEYFNCLGIMITIQDVHMKVNPGFPWKK